MTHALLNREFGQVRTAIVLGVGRGGTSVIAGCLRALGICMGRNVHPLKHEWSPVLYSSDGKLERAGRFSQPGKHAYRLFDAKPEAPPALIAEEDLRMDAERLAASVGKQYGADYLRRFNTLLAETRVTAEKLGSKLAWLERAGLT